MHENEDLVAPDRELLYGAGVFIGALLRRLGLDEVRLTERELREAPGISQLVVREEPNGDMTIRVRGDAPAVAVAVPVSVRIPVAETPCPVRPLDQGHEWYVHEDKMVCRACGLTVPWGRTG